MKIDSRFIFSVVIIGLVLFFFMRSAGNSVAFAPVMLEGGPGGGGGGGGGGGAGAAGGGAGAGACGGIFLWHPDTAMPTAAVNARSKTT